MKYNVEYVYNPCGDHLDGLSDVRLNALDEFDGFVDADNSEEAVAVFIQCLADNMRLYVDGERVDEYTKPDVVRVYAVNDDGEIDRNRHEIYYNFEAVEVPHEIAVRCERRKVWSEVREEMEEAADED